MLVRFSGEWGSGSQVRSLALPHNDVAVFDVSEHTKWCPVIRM